jgi:hypothetical protein
MSGVQGITPWAADEFGLQPSRTRTIRAFVMQGPGSLE